MIANDAATSEAQHFGPSWPEVAGVGEGTPQQAVFEFSRKGKFKNVQLWPQLPCLPFSGKAKNALFIDFRFAKKILFTLLTTV